MNDLDVQLKILQKRTVQFYLDAENSATPSAAYIIHTLVDFVDILIKALDKCREQRNSWSNYAQEFHFDELKEAENKDDEELLNILVGKK